MSAFKTLSATDGFGRLTAQTKALAVLGEAFPQLSTAIAFATTNLSAFIAVAAGIVGVIALVNYLETGLQLLYAPKGTDIDELLYGPQEDNYGY